MNTSAKIKNLFLRQSYQDAWADYEKALTKKYFIKWDYVILTASNESQAAAYRIQIEKRLAEHVLPPETHYAVLPDPGGRRVGSGGATLNVLQYIRSLGGENCFQKRILVIHSGGDSKRVPQYSACGKLFSPVPRELPDGRTSTLFDEFMINMASVPARIKGGMLVLSGDVLLLFNSLQIDAYGENAAAISIKTNAETGQNHGVFLNDGEGNVGEFLHKMPVEELREAGAVNQYGKVDLDTGAILLNSDILESLFSLISTEGESDPEKFNLYVNEKTRLSFYGDFLYPLASKSTLGQYLKEQPEGTFCDELLFCRKKIWDALHNYAMKLICLSPAEFIHFGTTKELLKLLTKNISDYEFLDWAGQISSVCQNNYYASLNSITEENTTVEAGAYLENAVVSDKAKVGKGCILSGVKVKGVKVPSQAVLHGLPLENGKFAVRVYGVEDNPKQKLEDGITFLGADFSSFLQTTGLVASDFWETTTHDLWNAMLYPVCDSMEEAVEWAIWLCNKMRGVSVETDKSISAYCKMERMSLSSSFNAADFKALDAWQENIADEIKVQLFIKSIQNNYNVEQTAGIFGTHGITLHQKQRLISLAKQAGFSLKIRIYYYLSRMTSGEESEQLEGACFTAIRDNICAVAAPVSEGKTELKIMEDFVEVQLPVRVNWGGGWSDTPPYCNEWGGTVLNASVQLDGRNPIVVKMKRLETNEIILASEDSGDKGVFHNIEDLKHCDNPFDPFALHKAALLACGIISAKEQRSVTRLTKEMGGGFYLSTSVVNIPRGSGLGTSSILAGACVKAIYQIFGQSVHEEAIYETVICMEQLMSTGGGWQDQVGGLTDGIKFITSRPGLNQDIEVEHVSVAPLAFQELNERFALIYTGQRRLARNILRDVVGKYIAGEKQSAEILNQIQRTAALMKFELQKGNIDAFAELLDAHWELSKRLDSGCTNTCIDQIFMSCEDLIDAKMVCGAGGGGFLQVILKREGSKADLQKRLHSVFQDSGVGVWNSKLI